jgi:nitrogenase-associated protein
MVEIVFYEKPGCINNSKQKKLLQDAGHELDCRNLLTETWSRNRLLKYFDHMSIPMWFNASAPEIKSGRIDPSRLSEEEALALMMNDPILIRRPLMQVGEEYRVGFDQAVVDAWIGLRVVSEADLEHCPRTHSETACDVTD